MDEAAAEAGNGAGATAGRVGLDRRGGDHALALANVEQAQDGAVAIQLLASS